MPSAERTLLCQYPSDMHSSCFRGFDSTILLRHNEVKIGPVSDLLAVFQWRQNLVPAGTTFMASGPNDQHRALQQPSPALVLTLPPEMHSNAVDPEEQMAIPEHAGEEILSVHI